MKLSFLNSNSDTDMNHERSIFEKLLNENDPFNKSFYEELDLLDQEQTLNEKSFESLENKHLNIVENEKVDFKQPLTTKIELWSYYIYYNGNNGYAIYSFLPIIFQYLAFKGGFHPDTPNIKGCDIKDTLRPCHVHWINSPNGIPVSSMLLYTQSIAFSIQFLVFTSFSSLADFGKWNKYILLGATVLGCTFQFLPVTLVHDDGSHVGVMMFIMIIALISYGASLVFYIAIFPNLSDNLPVVRYSKMNKNLSREEKQHISERWRNHLSAVSTTFSNIGFLVLTGSLSGISFLSWEGRYDFPEGVEHTLGNAPVFYFICIGTCAFYWAIFSIPYFLAIPKGRQGPPLPESTNYFTVGWISILKAFKEVRKLRYLFMYVICYFMFSDAVSTIGQMITIIQGELTGFSAQQNLIFNLITAITSIIGCLLFLWLSKTLKLGAKKSLFIIVILTAMVPIWGCFGIFFDNFGIRTHRELWVLNVWMGLFTAPIWAWQQILLAELVPKGNENLFFGLFGIVNKASSWIGPVVIGAITQSTSSIWKGWPFILSLFVVAIAVFCFIDVDQAKLELIEYEKNRENQPS